MTSKLLSECGTEFVVDAADKYVVAIDPGDYLVIEVGAVVGKPGAKLQHPNIAATVKRLYNFRTYFKSGAKRWYTKAGMSHYFVVPRSAITILPELFCALPSRGGSSVRSPSPSLSIYTL